MYSTRSQTRKQAGLSARGRTETSAVTFSKQTAAGNGTRQARERKTGTGITIDEQESSKIIAPSKQRTTLNNGTRQARGKKTSRETREKQEVSKAIASSIKQTTSDSATRKTKGKKTSKTTRKNSKNQDGLRTVTIEFDVKNRLKRILWRLTKELFPLGVIILKPFRKTHSLAIVTISVLLLVCYPIHDQLSESIRNFVFSLTSSPKNTVGLKELIPAPRYPVIFRSEEVEKIVSLMDNMTLTHPAREIHVYLVGGPGSGKSELARQVGLHLHRTKEIGPQPLDVITLEAESVNSLMHSFVEISLLLNKQRSQSDIGDESRNSINQILDELNLQRNVFQNEGDVLSAEKKLKWLFLKLQELLEERKSRPVLLFDNVKDLKVLFRYLKLEPGREDPLSMIVVMTIQKRVSLARLSGNFTAIVELHDGMKQDEALNLLGTITGLSNDSERAKELAKILGNQPLALAATAIYIQSVREGPPKNSRFSYSDYISEFKRDLEILGEEEQIEWEESEGSNYPDAMFISVLKAVNVTAQIDPVLRDIACAVGFTDTTRLSISFVLGYLKTNSHREYFGAQVRNTLRSCVLFKVEGDEDVEQLLSHQITRAAFRRICKVSSSNYQCTNNTRCTLDSVRRDYEKNLSNSLKETLSRIVAAFAYQMDDGAGLDNKSQNFSKFTISLSNSSFGSQFLDVLSSLCVHTTQEGLRTEEIIHVDFSVSFLLFFSRGFDYWPGLIKPVANEHKVGKLVRITLMAAKEESRCDIQTLLLIVCLHNGATKGFKETLVESLHKASSIVEKLTEKKVDLLHDDKREFKLGPVLLNTLGAMYRGLGYPYRSRTLHEKALKIFQVKTGINLQEKRQTLLEKATTLHKLGIINRYLGNLTLARENHQQSLRLLEDLHGSSHPSVAGSLLNLAVLYNRQASMNKALELCNRSLEIMEQTYGPGDPRVGKVLNTIGVVYYKLRNFEMAINNTERALEILESFHGKFHPHAAEALNFLGFIYRDQGNLIKSRELLERSIYVKEKIFDPNHFILAEALNDLGVVLTRLGEGHEAKKILNRALKIFKKTWGPHHSAVATTINSLGAANLVMGEPEKAKNMHEEALKIFMEVGGHDGHHIEETKYLLRKALQVLEDS